MRWGGGGGGGTCRVLAGLALPSTALEGCLGTLEHCESGETCTEWLTAVPEMDREVRQGPAAREVTVPTESSSCRCFGCHLRHPHLRGHVYRERMPRSSSK